MNKVFLIGRLTKDPELKFTAGTGIAVSTFTLAVDRSYTGQSGQREADFIPCIAWRGLATSIANNLGKGRLIGISGSIQTSSYQGQDGSKRYRTQVLVEECKYLDRAKENKGGEDDGFIPVEGDTPFDE